MFKILEALRVLTLSKQNPSLPLKKEKQTPKMLKTEEEVLYMLKI